MQTPQVVMYLLVFDFRLKYYSIVYIEYVRDKANNKTKTNKKKSREKYFISLLCYVMWYDIVRMKYAIKCRKPLK